MVDKAPQLSGHSSLCQSTACLLVNGDGCWGTNSSLGNPAVHPSFAAVDGGSPNAHGQANMDLMVVDGGGE